MFKNTAAKFMVFAFDATTGLPKGSDSANITCYVSKDYGTPTVLADTSATEMSNGFATGYYLFDATQGETNADCLMVSAKSTTANIIVTGAPAVIYTRPQTGWLAPATAGRTLVVDAAGLADANVVKLGPTGSGTAQTARDIGASVLLSSGTGTGQLDFTSGVVKGNVTQWVGVAPNALRNGRVDGITNLASGTAQAGAAGSITLAAGASSTNDLYTGQLITLDSSTGSPQTRLITAYNGTTKVATITPSWVTNPGASSTYVITPHGYTEQINSTVNTNITQISGDSTAADNLEAILDGTGGVTLVASAFTLTTPITANATQISGDPTAADNAESFFDGTGYAGTNNVIPTVTTVNGLANNSVTAAALAADAGTEIGTAVWATAARTLTAATNITSTGGTIPIASNGYVSALGNLESGTAQAGDALSITLAAGASSTNDLYEGQRVTIISGAGAGQTRLIAAYNGTSKVASITPGWTSIPDNTSVYSVHPHAWIASVSGNVYGSVLGDVSGSVGSVISAVNVNRINGDNDAAINLALMYNGTGYTDSTAPASRAQVEALPTATESADALLNRDWTAVSDTNDRTVLNALRAIRNKVSISAGTVTVTKEDDTTSAWSGAVTTDAAANPITAIDPT